MNEASRTYWAKQALKHERSAVTFRAKAKSHPREAQRWGRSADSNEIRARAIRTRLGAP